MKRILAILSAAITICGSVIGIRQCMKPVEIHPVQIHTYSVSIVYDVDVWEIPYALSYNEWEELFEVVESEAGGEDHEGKQDVANCIINKCRLKNERPSEVIRNDAYSHRKHCYTEDTKQAVIEVFNDGIRPLGDKATIFYTPALCTSEYHESQIFVKEHGGHKFFAERCFFV